jgi:glycosyltransferase involved in cell wall biosynthesis
MPPKNNRIIHVPRRFAQDEWGGTETVIVNFCRQQISAGWQPEIHTSMALNSTATETWNDIPVHRYKHVYPFFGLSTEEKHALDLKAGNLISLPFFFKLRAAKNVRLYHAHVTNRLGGETLTLARLQKKPCVVSLHGNVFDIPAAEAESLIEHQKGHFEWGKPFGMLFRSRKLLHEADAVMCVGYSEFEAASKALGHDRVYYLPNGVNADTFAQGDGQQVRDELGIGKNDIVFGCISRIDAQKGQNNLIDAFIHRASNDNSTNSHLILAGPITNPLYEKLLRSRIEVSGLSDRIHFLPAVQSESDAHLNLLHALDIFVLPSRHEPFGIVVLEAWSAGLPVIASKVGGLMQLIEHDTDGLHVEPGSVKDLSNAMAELACNPHKRNILAAAGNTKARTTYSWSNINQQLEAIYACAEARVRG